jgi:alpha-L-rhamnosidase
MRTAWNPPIKAQDFRCEYERNPPGIDVREPLLSWQLVSEQRGVVQSAYQIRVTNEQGEVVWDMGKVLSD